MLADSFLALQQRYVEALSCHPNLLELIQQLLRHAFGEIDQAMVVEDVDATDVLAVDIGLVGDRADDVTRLHLVIVADLDAKAIHARFRRPIPEFRSVATWF